MLLLPPQTLRISPTSLAHLPLFTLFAPQNFAWPFFFHFSWVLQPYQEKLKTMLMQNFRGQIRCIGDVQVANKASARLVTNRKEPWEGERREAKRVSPVFSFPPPFSRKFLSRERERPSTYEEPSSPFLILVKYEQNSQNFSWHWDSTPFRLEVSCCHFVINSSAIFKNRLLFPDLFYYHDV